MRRFDAQAPVVPAIPGDSDGIWRGRSPRASGSERVVAVDHYDGRIPAISAASGRLGSALAAGPHDSSRPIPGRPALPLRARSSVHLFPDNSCSLPNYYSLELRRATDRAARRKLARGSDWRRVRETSQNGRLAIASEGAEPGYTDRGYTRDTARDDAGRLRRSRIHPVSRASDARWPAVLEQIRPRLLHGQHGANHRRTNQGHGHACHRWRQDRRMERRAQGVLAIRRPRGLAFVDRA
jgi:hypothetical protein